MANPVQGASRASPTRPNGLLRDAILQAAEVAGGREGIVGYHTQQAEKHPATFLALIGRVLPLQVQDRDTSEQISVQIVYRGYSERDEPKLVEHVVDQTANAAATAVRTAPDTDALFAPTGEG